MTAEDVLQELLKMHDNCKGSHNYYLHAVVHICQKFAVPIEHVHPLSMSRKRVQNSQESIHDPAEIRRVFEIDAADYPPPDSGFMKL